MQNFSRRQALLAGSMLAISPLARSAGQASSPSNSRASLIKSITKVTLHQNRDGKSETWFHPRACLIPGPDQTRRIFMTRQWIRGSDYFGPVQCLESDDLGDSWTQPADIKPLGRVPVNGHPGLMAGVCDVVPQYHGPTQTILALGHVVFYRGPRFAKGDQLARYPVYAVRKKDGTWGPRRILRWNDPQGAFIYSNNCGQRVVMNNGDIMMAFTFGPESKNRMVAGVRCSFDGHRLKVEDVGPALKLNVGRGLLEPSVTRFGDQFFMTIRAEDGHGYVSTSDDGLDFKTMTAWGWDDGEKIQMSTTQQHWLNHSDGLFLVYTRRDDSNSNVIRWRAPLFVAQVDTERRCLIRDSERIVLPLVGDGVAAPDDVGLMGNFNITNVNEQESWVTVGEWLPKRKATGDMLIGKIRWNRPNRELDFQPSE